MAETVENIHYLLAAVFLWNLFCGVMIAYILGKIYTQLGGK